MKKYQWLTLSLTSMCLTASFAQAAVSVPESLQGNFTTVSCQILQGQNFGSMASLVAGTNVQFNAKGSDLEMVVTKDGGSWGFLTFANVNGSANVNKSYDPFPFGCTGSEESSTASSNELTATYKELGGFGCNSVHAVSKASIVINADGSLTYAEQDLRAGAVTYHVTCSLSK